MKILRTITDADFGENIPASKEYKKREAVRAVAFDENNHIALLFSQKNNFHKLPGGGMEEGEDFETALRRELMEEIGCTIEAIQELGIIEEFRNKFDYNQTSYCYTAKITSKGEPQLEPDEIEEGLVTRWYTLQDAVRVIEAEGETLNEHGKFMHLRELEILKIMTFRQHKEQRL